MRLILLLVVYAVLSEAFTGPGRRWAGVKLSPQHLSKSAESNLKTFKSLPNEAKEDFFAEFLARNEESMMKDQERINELHERINELHENSRKIESKDQELQAQYKLRLMHMETELLRAKGLLTARGMFEHFMQACFKELVVAEIFTEKAKFNVSEVILRLKNNKKSIKEKEHMKSCNDFFSYQEECGLEDVALLHEELCREIHGYPWSGEGVRMHADLLKKKGFSCYLTKILSRHDLKPQYEDGDVLCIQ